MPPSADTLAPAIRKPPAGWAVLLLVGPSFIWAAEYIGSGEVILATRTGAVLGTTVIWAVVLGIVLKFWIGLSGARYTVCTGEGMVDMIGRMPGPKNWAVWIVLVGQLAAGIVSVGSIAAAGGVFLASLTGLAPALSGGLITLAAVALVWYNAFDLLKIVMSLFVLVMVAGVLYVASFVFPGWSAFLAGLVPSVPEVPAWAVAQGTSENAWAEVLPLLGWGAGGFASQVWYTYWVLGAGYGAAHGRGYGEPADVDRLRRLTRLDAERLKGWCRVVYADASVAVVIGTVVTVGFLIAGAGILGAAERAPEGPQVAFTLAELFSSRWGAFGGTLFLVGGLAALVATQVAQLAGWPRLLADAVRLCIPRFSRAFAWKVQYRLFIGLFLLTNLFIVTVLGEHPVALVKTGAILDGLLLTPLQALWVGLGLYVVMPKMVSDEARRVLRPNAVFAVGLLLAFLVFGYFCVFQLPNQF